MARTPIDITALELDESGRVVLSDDLLDKITASELIVSAGANPQWCPGTSNWSCTNSQICERSSNGWCTNENFCDFAQNRFCYDSPV